MAKPRKLKRVVIKEELVALTGDWLAALVLNQFLYWSERVHDVDEFIKEERRRSQGQVDMAPTCGWIYKSTKELKEELMIHSSEATIRRRIAHLVENGWLGERNNPKYAWDRTLQYRPNTVAIQRDLARLGYPLAGYTFEECILHGEGSKPQGEGSNPHSEGSKPQGEGSNPHGEEAIPENTTQTTKPEITISETTTDNTAVAASASNEKRELLSPLGINLTAKLEALVDQYNDAQLTWLVEHVQNANVNNPAGLAIAMMKRHELPILPHPEKDAPRESSPVDDLSAGQKRFLTLFGASGYSNRTQARAIERLEERYGVERLLEVGRWAATKGMSLGEAVVAVTSALKKQQGGTDGRETSRSEATGEGTSKAAQGSKAATEHRGPDATVLPGVTAGQMHDKLSRLCNRGADMDM